jgi:hypothetical protein
MARQHIVPLIAAAALASASLAVAQNSIATFTPKSPGLAQELSLLGTLVPVVVGYAGRSPGSASSARYVARGLLAYGLFVGPATGYLYAGEVGRGARGVAIRAAIAGATVAGALLTCKTETTLEDWGDSLGCVAAWGLIGALGFSWSVVHDIGAAGSAVEHWNTTHGPARVTVTPRIDPATQSGGLSVRVTF